MTTTNHLGKATYQGMFTVAHGSNGTRNPAVESKVDRLAMLMCERPGAPAYNVAGEYAAENWKFFRRAAHMALITELALREYWVLDPGTHT